jgi:hypothetical protein
MVGRLLNLDIEKGYWDIQIFRYWVISLSGALFSKEIKVKECDTDCIATGCP